ncbi:MAG: hypothetical protein JWN34_1559 [Bryobacterales bacterium]|nr:hypothetical protein [Bryobacterales bacterium]
MLLLATATAFAQSDRGTITGTVTDPSGAIIPTATIKATNTETGAKYETTTTSTGNYTLPQLSAGVYDLETVSPGFATIVQKGIRIQVASTNRIDIKLQVSATNESITVVSDAPLLKTESGEQSSNITTEKILKLPLYGGNGRNSGGGFRSPYAFMTTMASATIVPSGGNNSIRVNGLQNDTYSTRIEGQEATNTQQPNASHINPGVEAIEEVTLQTSNFAAEYGEIGGGLINFTAKSGTNQLHGSAFEYLRNEFLNAGQPFTDAGNSKHIRARTRSNDYGFSVGGPVWIPRIYNGHNKTFFNFNLEAAPGTSTASSLISVPSAAFRGGDFSSILTGKNLGPDAEGRTIFENTLYDPKTNHLVSGLVSRDPFPGNIIPPSRFDPVSVKIQNLMPKATTGGNINNYQQNFSAPTGAKLFTTKVDHNLGANSKIAFYYSHKISNGWTQPDDLPVPITAVRRGTNNNPTVRLNFYQTLRPTLMLNVGVGFIRNLNPDPAVNGVLEYDAPGLLGFVGGATTYFTGKAAVGFPRITGISGGLGGAPNLGPVNANIYNTQKPSAVANLTWVKNNHTFKFGGEWRKDASTDRNVRGSQGILNFSTQQTALPSNQNLNGGGVGFAYASFLLGLADSGTVSTAQDPQFLKTSWGMFAQDSWKITPRLTVELGVRYDFQSGLRELWDRLGSFDPRVANPSAGGLPGGMAYAGYGNGRCNCEFAPGYRWGFQPRLGFAYRVNDKTVLRGGWGIAYGQTANYNYISNTPIVGVGFNQLSFNRPSFGEPAFTLQGGLPYNPASLNSVSLNPGIRPNPGQVDSPPYWLDPNGGRPPRINQFSIGVQRQLTGNLVVEASYVGNRAAWLQATSLLDLNAVTPETLKAKGIDFNSATDRALLSAQLGSTGVQARGFKAPYAGFPLTQSLLQALKPFPQFSSIPVRWSPLGDSWYDSLQAKVTKRYSHGLDVSGSFNWQKELSLGADGGTINDVFNRPNQKTISPQSTPFVFVLAANYQTPVWGPNRWMRLATGGWTIGTVLRYQSGLPIAVPTAQNSLGTQLGRGTIANRVAGQPLFLKDPNCGCFDPNSELILNPNAWAEPAAGQWGTSAAYYNDYRGARRPSEQIAFGRTFRIHESIGVELQAMFFNALNRTYLNNPDSTNARATRTTGANGSLTGGFGRVNTGTTVFGPRDGVLSMRVHF